MLLLLSCFRAVESVSHVLSSSEAPSFSGDSELAFIKLNDDWIPSVFLTRPSLVPQKKHFSKISFRKTRQNFEVNIFCFSQVLHGVVIQS